MTTSISSIFEMDPVLHQGSVNAPDGNIIFNGDGQGVNTLLQTAVPAGNNAGTPITRAALGGAPALGPGVTAVPLFAHGITAPIGLAFAAPTSGDVTGGPDSNNLGEFFTLATGQTTTTAVKVAGTPNSLTNGPDVTDPIGKCQDPTTGKPRVVGGKTPTNNTPMLWVVDPNSNVIHRVDDTTNSQLDNSGFHSPPPIVDDPNYPNPTIANFEINPSQIPLIDPSNGNPVLPGEIVGIVEQDPTDFPQNVGRVWFTAPYEVNVATDRIVPFNSIGFINIQTATPEDPCSPAPQNGNPVATISVARPVSFVSGGAPGQTLYAHFVTLLDAQPPPVGLSINSIPVGLTLGVSSTGTPDPSVIWVTVAGENVVYRVGTSSKKGLLAAQDTFTYEAAATGASEVVGGHDGNIYFLMPKTDQVGSIPSSASPGNPVEVLSLPTQDANGTAIAPGQGLAGILLGADNRVWFSMANSNKMGSVGSNANQILSSDVFDLGLKTEDAAGKPIPGDANGAFPPVTPTTAPVTCRPGGLVNTTVGGAPIIQFVLGDWCTTANFGVDGITSEFLGQINTPVSPTTGNPRGLVGLGKATSGGHRYAPTGIVKARQGGNADIYVLTNNDNTALRNRSNFIFRYSSDAANLGRLVDQHDVSAKFPAGSQMEQILEDNTGNLWVTSRGLNQIVKLSPGLVVLSTITTTFPTEGVALDELGNVWFTEYDQSKFDPTGATANSMIGEVPAGAGTGTVVGVGGAEIALPNNSKPFGIAPGPTGTNSMWVCLQFGGGQIQAGQLQEVNITTRTLMGAAVKTPTVGAQPQSIVLNGGVGGDGKLYFTEVEGNNIGVLDPTTSKITEVVITTASSKPTGIAIAADNTPWFVETTGDKVGRLSLTNGQIEETPITSGDGGPTFLTPGADDASGNHTLLLPLLDLDRLAVLSFKVH